MMTLKLTITCERVNVQMLSVITWSGIESQLNPKRTQHLRNKYNVTVCLLNNAFNEAHHRNSLCSI